MVNDDEVELKLNDAPAEKWYRQNLNDNEGFFLGGAEYFKESNYFINQISSGLNISPDFQSASNVDFLIDTVRSEAKHD